MLVHSNKKNEKIVWGLLSYTFDEEQETTTLKDYLEIYNNNPEYTIFLYKEEDSENFVGVMVMEQDHQFETPLINIHRVALLPSHRHEGIGYLMYVQLREMYPKATIQGTVLMSEIVKNWSVKYRNEVLN